MGLDGFAVTDHDSTGVFEEIPKDSGLLIIPGVEVSSKNGHILALGVAHPVKSGLPASDTIDEIHALGGVAVAAHPLDWPFRSSLSEKELLGLRLDAIETVNAMTPFFRRFKGRTEALAASLGLSRTGGSDAHMLDDIGLAYSIVEVEDRSMEGVLRAIRGGKVEAFGRKAPLMNRAKKLAFQLGRKVRFTPPSGLSQG